MQVRESKVDLLSLRALPFLGHASCRTYFYMLGRYSLDYFYRKWRNISGDILPIYYLIN